MSEETEKHLVFLSHATPDRECAEIVQGALEADGLDCWVAYRDIKAGADWGESIDAALKEADLLLVLISPGADASRHVVREVAGAVDLGKEILPVRVEDIEPTKSLRYHLQTLHRLDAFPPPLENHVRNIIDNVRSVLAGNTTRIKKRAIKDLIIEPAPPAPLPPELLMITGMGVNTSQQAVDLLTQQLADTEVELQNMDPKIKEYRGPEFLDCLENIELVKTGLRQAEALLREDKDVHSQVIGIIADSKTAIQSRHLNLAENRFEEAVNLCQTKRVQETDIWKQLKELQARLADADAEIPPENTAGQTTTTEQITPPEEPPGSLIETVPPTQPLTNDEDDAAPATDGKTETGADSPDDETVVEDSSATSEEQEPEPASQPETEDTTRTQAPATKTDSDPDSPAIDTTTAPEGSEAEPSDEPIAAGSGEPDQADEADEDEEPTSHDEISPAPVADETPPPDEAHSARIWMIAAGIVLLLGVLSFIVFSKGNREHPNLASPLLGQVVEIGQDVALNLQPTGREPIAIQWLRDGQPIADATNAQHSFKATAGATEISVQLKNELATFTSEPAIFVAGMPAKIASYDPPLAEIVVHPTKEQVLQATVLEQPAATNLFTWIFGGKTVQESASPKFTLADLSFEDAGRLMLIAANQWGRDTNTWLVKVDGTPVIKKEPQNVAVVAGQTAVFSVIADGEPPLTYFWLTQGRFLQRTEKPQLSLPTAVGDTEAPSQIQVLVSNKWDIVKSKAVSLTLNLPPNFVKQPQNLGLREGDNGKLEALAENGNVSYQWYRDDHPLPNERSPIVTFKNANNSFNGAYHVVAANQYGSLTSAVAQVSVRRGPKFGDEWSRDVGNGVPIMFAPIPAGSFAMGSPTPEDGRGPDEEVHQVTFTNSFWVSRHEITQAQYEALIGIVPALQKRGPNLPIHNVTWTEADNFCARLQKELAGTLPPGFEIRLPTEAEWEYSARGGIPAMYGFNMAESKLDEYAVNRNIDDIAGIDEVGKLRPNPYGLSDVHGNVEEWCFDWYNRRLRSAANPVYRRPTVGRVVRGGHWKDELLDMRVAKRRHSPPNRPHPHRGFRVVAAPAIPRDGNLNP